MTKIDMSAEAVTGRLRRVDELRDLCRVLAGPRLKYPDGGRRKRRKMEMAEDGRDGKKKY